MIPLANSVRSREFPWVTWLLIAANLAVFVGWQLPEGVARSVGEAGLAPRQLVGRFGVTSPGLVHLGTYMFLHAGWMHLLGNLWFLWVFGPGVEQATGSPRFALFYGLAGVVSALVHVWLTGPSRVPLVGASGAISGVLGAFLVLYPRARVLTLVPIFIILRLVRLPAWVFLLVWVGLQALAEASTFAVRPAGGSGGVAYLVHLGGFAFGAGAVWVFRPGDRPRAPAAPAADPRPWPGEN